MKVAEVRKALVALGAGIIAVAALFGVVIDSNVVAAIAAGVAPLAVYAIPND